MYRHLSNQLECEWKLGLTVDEIRQTLQETARPTITFPIDETVPGAYDFDSGFGLVDAAAALDALD